MVLLLSSGVRGVGREVRARRAPGDRRRRSHFASYRAAGAILVSLGTVYDGDAALLRRLAQAAISTGLPVVVAAGRSASALSDLDGGSISVRDVVPWTEAVRQARAVLSHGGFNTVMPSVLRGIPTLVVPLGSDHGLTVARIGGLSHVHVMDRHDSDQAFRQALRRALLRQPELPADHLGEAVRTHHVEVAETDALQ